MSSISSKKYYDILGVLHTASDQEIREAYKKKALTSHPDRAAQNNLTNEKATESFKLLKEAYEILSDPQKRTAYDLAESPIFDFSFFERYTSYMRDPSPHFPQRNVDDYEEICAPDTLNQEMETILDEDNSDHFDQFLKSNPFYSSRLKSILYHACRRGKGNIAKYLIEVKKISPKLKVLDGLKFTGAIFKAAAESGNLSLVKYLLEVHHV